MVKMKLGIVTLISSCLALPAMLMAQGSGITVTVSPQSETTYIGTTRQYTATVMGTMNMGVKWAINGVVGGGGMFGSISQTGVYSPPATLPNPASAMVQAISMADTSVMGTATAKIGSTAPPPPPTPPPPQTTFAINTITPGIVPVGAFSLTISGAGFVSGTQISFGGAAIPTVYVNANTLTASGTATAAQTGVVAVIATKPNNGGTAPSAVLVTNNGPTAVSLSTASRFLQQAGFGPMPADTTHVQQIGLQAWLAEQFNLQGTSNYHTPAGVVQSMSARFLTNAVNQPDQLRQKVAFALSQIWVISLNKLNWNSEVIPYQEMLLANAFGNVQTLLKKVTLDPAMGVYLDMVNNDKATSAAGVQPNENYAREVMQLFTIGTTLLNLDGTPQTDAMGNPLPAYSQTDVAETARALTGWTFAPLPGKPSFAHNNYNIGAPMVFYQPNHDAGAKTVVHGFQIAGSQMADVELDLVIANLFNHPNMPPFFSKLLIQHLVMSNPKPAYVQRVAMKFMDNGVGVRGDMKAILTAILTDQDARAGDDPLAVSSSDGHMQEPALYLAGLMRGLSAYCDDTNYFSWDLFNMSQDLFRSPSVFNYYKPNFVPQGTTLLGPEFQIFTPNAAIYRINLNATLFSSYSNLLNSNGPGTVFDLTPWANLASNPATLVDALDNALTGGTMPAQMKQAVVNAVAGTSGNLRRAQTAIFLIATSNFYEVWH